MTQDDQGPQVTPPTVPWAEIPTANDEEIKKDVQRLKESEEARVAQPRAAARSAAAKNKRNKRGVYVAKSKKKEPKEAREQKVVLEYDSVIPRVEEETEDDPRPVRYDLRFHKPRGRGGKVGVQGIPSPWSRKLRRPNKGKVDGRLGRSGRRKRSGGQILDRNDATKTTSDASKLHELDHAGGKD